MRALRASTREIVGPPYAHDGERERLTAEYRDLKSDLDRLPPKSRLRAGLEYRIQRITTRLLMIGDAVPLPPVKRADYQ